MDHHCRILLLIFVLLHWVFELGLNSLNTFVKFSTSISKISSDHQQTILFYAIIPAIIWYFFRIRMCLYSVFFFCKCNIIRLMAVTYWKQWAFDCMRDQIGMSLQVKLLAVNYHMSDSSVFINEEWIKLNKKLMKRCVWSKNRRLFL